MTSRYYTIIKIRLKSLLPFAETKSLANDESDKEKQLEILNFQIDELEAADIKIGEREELTKKRELIQKSEDIIKALNLAVSTINGDDENTGVEQACNDVSRMLF